MCALSSTLATCDIPSGRSEKLPKVHVNENREFVLSKELLEAAEWDAGEVIAFQYNDITDVFTLNGIINTSVISVYMYVLRC